MPRKPRFFLPGIPVHIVNRGHSRAPVFFERSDYRAYLNWLEEAAGRYNCAIQAYVLMTNHVHILATPRDKNGISRMMQYVGRRYVPYINHTYGTSGSIWEGRFKASLVSDEQYLVACMRYIELNPVRADMVNSPSEYPWSSYHGNALGYADSLISPHPVYLALAKKEHARLAAYKAMFSTDVDDKDILDIRKAVQTGTPLGNVYFREKIEKKLGWKVGYNRRGRPKKALTP